MNKTTWGFLLISIGAILGLSIGGFVQKTKIAYDADLVKFENKVVAVTPSNVTPTATPDDGEAVIAKAAKQMDLAVHDKDFIPMPPITTTYENYPVEFDLPTPTHITKPHQNCIQAYYKFYHMIYMQNSLPWKDDFTIINGFHRASTFGVMPLDIFEKMHKPFFGIQVYYDAPYETWIYCVWSMKRKAPIPFAYPSKAVAFMKRQQGKS